MLLELRIGDWSGDGHGITESLFFHVNSIEEVEGGYAEGCKILGFDFTSEVASDYEDTKVPAHILEKLNEHGLLEDFDTEDWEEFGIDYDQYLKIYLNIVKLGNPNFHIKEHKMQTIDIGGYGFFGG